MDIVVYSALGCRHCQATKASLEERKLHFTVVEMAKMTEDDLRALKALIGREHLTVPQIFVGGNHVGGNAELQEELKSGAFDRRIEDGMGDGAGRACGGGGCETLTKLPGLGLSGACPYGMEESMPVLVALKEVWSRLSRLGAEVDAELEKLAGFPARSRALGMLSVPSAGVSAEELVEAVRTVCKREKELVLEGVLDAGVDLAAPLYATALVRCGLFAPTNGGDVLSEGLRRDVGKVDLWVGLDRKLVHVDLCRGGAGWMLAGDVLSCYGSLVLSEEERKEMEVEEEKGVEGVDWRGMWRNGRLMGPRLVAMSWNVAHRVTGGPWFRAAWREEVDEEVLNGGTLTKDECLCAVQKLDGAGDLYTKVLETMDRYAGPAGVDYEAMRTSGEAEFLSSSARYLRCTDIGALPDQVEKTFWLNMYNILTIHAVLLGGAPTSALQRKQLYNNTLYKIGPHRLSPTLIEHGILRCNQRAPYSLSPPFSASDPRNELCLSSLDPRIHFALVCGARSCPAVRVYKPHNLDMALDDAVKTFLETDENFGILVNSSFKKLTIQLSAIFNWYVSDFGGSLHHAVHWCIPFLSKAKQETLKAHIPPLELETIQKNVNCIVAPYDWSLNTADHHHFEEEQDS